MVLAPAAQRSLRQLITVAVIAVTALTIHLAGQAAAGGTEPSSLVQVSSTSVVPGQTVQSYQMTVTNLGEATAVELPAPVPARSIVDAATDTGVYSEGTWSVGSLDAGATATLNLTARN
jgi:hypothetical protein